MSTRYILIIAVLLPITLLEASAQGIDSIIVETYYINKGVEAKDAYLPEGSITYRIYVDMAEGYKLQAVFGNNEHPMFIETSTYFYNDTTWGEKTGEFIHKIIMNQNAMSYDSWLSMGAGAARYYGVLRSEDADGSVLTGKYMADHDGLIEGEPPTVVLYGLDLNEFYKSTEYSYFYSNNGAWANLGGVEGPTPENRVLIAQITTNGDLSFKFNLQLDNSDCGVIQYVAENPSEEQRLCEGLKWSSSDYQKGLSQNIY
jgi:hypothetical protein